VSSAARSPQPHPALRDADADQHVQTHVTDVTWARVDDGFYVGSRDGSFLGCIDALPDGRFAALDALTRPIRTCHHLREAMQAVLAAGEGQVTS
jgi:hypothetical protein